MGCTRGPHPSRLGKGGSSQGGLPERGVGVHGKSWTQPGKERQGLEAERIPPYENRHFLRSLSPVIQPLHFCCYHVA